MLWKLIWIYLTFPARVALWCLRFCCCWHSKLAGNHGARFHFNEIRLSKVLRSCFTEFHFFCCFAVVKVVVAVVALSIFIQSWTCARFYLTYAPTHTQLFFVVGGCLGKWKNKFDLCCAQLCPDSPHTHTYKQMQAVMKLKPHFESCSVSLNCTCCVVNSF